MKELKEIVRDNLRRFRVVPAARRLAPAAPALPLADRMAALLAMVRYQLVRSRDDLLAVEGLRSAAYRAAGVVPMRWPGRLIDEWDYADNAAVFLVRCNGRLCASLRVHVSTDEGFPTPGTAAYPAQLLPLLRSGRRLVAVSCLCTEPGERDRQTELGLCALRVAVMIAQLRSRTMITLWSRPEHAAFYRHVLGCTPVAGERREPGRNVPLVLLLSDFDRNYSATIQAAPYLAAAPGETAEVLAGSFQ